MSKKWVYFFGEGNKGQKDILGGKGANLSEMTNIGIPVPPGFTITAQVCKAYYENDEQYPEGVMEQVEESLKKLENKIGKEFGNEKDPLLVSVRSGAAQSMPGMMDTVLNIGLNNTTVKAVAEKTGNQRFAYDAYRRLIQMFGHVVMGVDTQAFENILETKKETKGVEYDKDLDINDLKQVVNEFKKVYKERTGKEFPQSPQKQMKMAVDAVFGSWNNTRAIKYRKLHNITGLLGTAVNIQAMVFGNMGNNSGTGVAFTRNPSTGQNKFYGEYLINAQGEDVVAGIRTPKEITQLKEDMPEIYNQLLEIRKKLEQHYKDVQDIEFTIQEGKLYLLQTRTGKRTGVAAVKIAVDMVKEGLINKETAVKRVNPNKLKELLHKRIDPIAKEEHEVIAKGLPASPGAAVGKIVFTAENAVDETRKGEKVILVRKETSPEDIEGLEAAQGVLTSRGGITSHAAVVARGMGKCCVAGCEDLTIDYKNKQISIAGKEFILKENEWITLDGLKGEVYKDKMPVVDPQLSGEFSTLMEWANEFRKLKVRANADNEKDAKKALELGAEGIGLTRTEHMFFEGNRIKAMREMILSTSREERNNALEKLLPMQKQDFKAIFEAMEGKPVTIRLLDPPLHEFLPTKEEEIKKLSKSMNIDLEKIKEKIDSLKEVNPMLGHRGCRLAITYPEIPKMQVKAIMKAAKEVKDSGKEVLPEIEVPLIGNVTEIKEMKKIIEKTASQYDLDYKIGTMIEIPRACITASEIAKEVDFFSFGTNDLTQMSLGFSRDDIGKFVNDYIDKDVLETDPFKKLDQNGVGKLMDTCVKNARKQKPGLEIGICGEHGGESSSVKFCHKIGLNYVSCSPYRIPIAILAAAQANLNQ